MPDEPSLDTDAQSQPPAPVKTEVRSSPESTLAPPVAHGTATKAEAQVNDLQTRTWIRRGSFGWGCLFLGLAGLDAIWDVLPFASMVELGGTGIALVIGAITGKTGLKNADD